MQVNTGNYQSKCATELIQFYDIQRNIYYEFASNVAYEKGRDQKGNGRGSFAGYKIAQFVAWLDILVELTNLYNECQLDYYMQAWAPMFTSLSGFLGIFTSLWIVIIDEKEVPNYYGMSQAAFNRQPANAGKFFGLWCRDLWGVEL